MNSNSDNSRVGQEFQERVCMIMQQYWGKNFGLEVPISIGAPPKEHRFDCASKDKSIVVECNCKGVNGRWYSHPRKAEGMATGNR